MRTLPLRGVTTTAFAPTMTSSSTMIFCGAPVDACTARVTLCQILTRRPMTTLAWIIVPNP
jgi:hypothetical protein